MIRPEYDNRRQFKLVHETKAFVPDPYTPHADDHEAHLDAVHRASKRKGFPVAPAPRTWP